MGCDVTRERGEKAGEGEGEEESRGRKHGEEEMDKRKGSEVKSRKQRVGYWRQVP